VPKDQVEARGDLLRHGLVLSHTVRCERRNRAVGDVNASAGVSDQLMALLNFLLIPLVIDAGDSTCLVDGFAGVQLIADGRASYLAMPSREGNSEPAVSANFALS
jgi:hypothetical protein